MTGGYEIEIFYSVFFHFKPLRASISIQGNPANAQIITSQMVGQSPGCLFLLIINHFNPNAMKKIISLALLLLTMVFFSCEKDDSDHAAKTGRVHIEVGSSIQVKELDEGFKTIPQVDDFIVIIYQSDGSVAMQYNRLVDMPDTLDLPVGEYYVEAYSDNLVPAEFDNPYYYGVSGTFTVASNALTTVEVNCTLSNTIVTVVYSDNVTGSFSGYSTNVSTTLGSLVYDETETRKGYFQTLPLDISVDLMYLKPDGTPVSRNLAGSIPEPLPNKHYQVNVDASITEGMAGFLIIQDTSDVLLEVIEISDFQDTVGTGGVMSYGDLIITEIMYDPSALSDTEGEWFEIYNNSGQSVNLQNMVINRDDTNIHTISDSIILEPMQYFVFMRSEEATDAASAYVYGSAITLSNTGAVLSILNPDDGDTPGDLIFSVSYGAGFPSGSGASICLDPSKMNPAEAVLGTSWCTSSSVYSTGDFGTPGSVNDACQ